VETVSLDEYTPTDLEDFGFQLRLLVGPADSEGEESFDVTVCTPPWLAAQCEADGFVLGRNHLVLRRFSAPEIRQILTKTVQRCSGNSWSDVAAKVSRIG
jgi:hypothetical protein